MVANIRESLIAHDPIPVLGHKAQNAPSGNGPINTTHQTCPPEKTEWRACPEWSYARRRDPYGFRGLLEGAAERWICVSVGRATGQGPMNVSVGLRQSLSRGVHVSRQ